jgi:glycosyltransferase involved in cell wall biosynthesis
MPTVTVVLPTYNRAATLGRAAQSVLAQTFSDLELIVVDDGSADDTEDLISRLMTADGRIRYMKHPTNLGQARARNTGIGGAAGEFVAFQDSDDEWRETKLARQVAQFRTLPETVGLVYCGMDAVGPEGRRHFPVPCFSPAEKDLYRKGLRYAFSGIGIQSCMFRRRVFETSGMFDEEMKALEDMELLLRAARHYGFSCIEETLVLYYKDPGGVARNHEKNLSAALHILEKYRGDIAADHTALAVHYRRIATLMGKVGRRREARKLKVKAWLLDATARLLQKRRTDGYEGS